MINGVTNIGVWQCVDIGVWQSGCFTVVPSYGKFKSQSVFTGRLKSNINLDGSLQSGIKVEGKLGTFSSEDN